MAFARVGVRRKPVMPGLRVRGIRWPSIARTFLVIARIDNTTELEYLRNGGILPLVLRQLIRAN